MGFLMAVQYVGAPEFILVEVTFKLFFAENHEVTIFLYSLCFYQKVSTNSLLVQFARYVQIIFHIIL